MLTRKAAAAAHRDTERPSDHSSRTTIAPFDWHFTRLQCSQALKRKWSAIKYEHSYFKEWIPLEDSRPNLRKKACNEEAHPDTGLVRVNTHMRSKWAVMYKGKLLSLHNVHRRNHFGENMLHQAVIQGDIPKIRAILQLKPDVNLTDHTGWTALHEAALRGHYQACVLLIQSGASVNVAGQNGVTPLHYAVQSKHVQIEKLLLKHGADPWLMDHNGGTAFNLCDEPAQQILMLQRPQEQRRSSKNCLISPIQGLQSGNIQSWSPKESDRSEDLISSALVRTQPSGVQCAPIQLGLEVQRGVELEVELELETSNKDSVPPSSFGPEACVSAAASGEWSPLSGGWSPLSGRRSSPLSLLSLWPQQDSGGDSDSDQTINYLSGSDDSEDWSFQDTQNFSGSCTTAHTEDSAWYTFPTECA